MSPVYSREVRVGIGWDLGSEHLRCLLISHGPCQAFHSGFRTVCEGLDKSFWIEPSSPLPVRYRFLWRVYILFPDFLWIPFFCGMSYSHLGAISYINCVTPVMILFLRQARRSFHRSSVDVAASVSLYCVVSFQMTVTDCHPRTSLGFGCSECMLLLPSRSRCVSILQTWSCTTATSPTAPASWRSSTRWSPPRSTTSEPRATSRWAVRRSVLSLLCPELRILLFSVASFFSLSFVSFII